MVVRGANYPRKPNEFYATPIETTQVLLDVVWFTPTVCDPACGDGAIVSALLKNGYMAVGTDLTVGADFLTEPYDWPYHDIVTNPPFGKGGRLAAQFIERAIEVTAQHQRKFAMLLPIDFDSGSTRARLFDHPAFAMKIVLRNRIRWFNGVSGASNHCWCVWDWAHKGPPIIKYGKQEYPNG
jgi:predicted RNA methylase